MVENYRHLYVVIELEDEKFLPVSLEMLGEARRLLDGFNKKYSSKEKVVAVVLGHNIKNVSKQLIEYGADAVIFSDSPELKDVRNTIYTKVISQIAQDSKTLAEVEPEYASEIKRPRYMFFSADSIGRHLSSTVLAELESGLASDINKLVIEDIEMSHQQKTGGKKETYAKTLEMYRPDFSGFLWTTILCLDNRNPAFKRDYHPQACSMIPGVFEPIKQDSSRQGKVIEFAPTDEPASKRIACFPSFESLFNAANPAEPPPTIATSYLSKSYYASTTNICFLISSINNGTTSSILPFMKISHSFFIGASSSGLIATTNPESFIPHTCCIAPLTPAAIYNKGLVLCPLVPITLSGIMYSESNAELTTNGFFDIGKVTPISAFNSFANFSMSLMFCSGSSLIPRPKLTIVLGVSKSTLL